MISHNIFILLWLLLGLIASIVLAIGYIEGDCLIPSLWEVPLIVFMVGFIITLGPLAFVPASEYFSLAKKFAKEKRVHYYTALALPILSMISLFFI